MQIIKFIKEGNKSILRFLGADYTHADISYEDDQLVFDKKVFFNKTINSNVVNLDKIHKNTDTFRLDVSDNHLFTLTLDANKEITSLKGAESGMVYTIVVQQDSTGSRTLTLPDTFKYVDGVAPTITEAAGSIDIVSIAVIGNHYLVSVEQDFKVSS